MKGKDEAMLKKRTLQTCAAIAATALVACHAAAEVRYVNASNYGLAGLDGRSPTTAWGTLQDAHDNANDDDIIKILPGVYDQGGSTHSDNGHPNRLTVTKRLVFEATGGCSNTFIEGKLDYSANEAGYGSQAIRCIYVAASGYGTVFKNLTLRNGGSSGSTSDPYTTGKSGGYGGGLLVCGGWSLDKDADVFKAYLVDCVVSNCAAVWGGAMRGGTAIRCLLLDNRGRAHGYTACSSALWNSVIAGSRHFHTVSRAVLGYKAIAANCTLSGCSGEGGNLNVKFCNCVILQQASGDMCKYSDLATEGASIYTNCFGSAADAYPVISPATGDFRPRAGSPLVGGGNMDDLLNAVRLPEGTSMTDYNGNTINTASETCDAGAVQGAISPAGGRFVFPGASEVNGFHNNRDSYSYASQWPSAICLRPTADRFFRVELSGSTADATTFRYADYNGFVRMLYPPSTNDSTTVNQATYGCEFWCSPDADATVADGSSLHPFKTLKAAMSHVSGSAYATSNIVIRALPGDYNLDSTVAYDHPTRVVFPANRSVLLKSTGGATVTTIRGAADPETLNAEAYQGCGSNAVRCVVFENYNSVSSGRALQGFTIADGHSNYTSCTRDNASDLAGGVYAQGAEQNTARGQNLTSSGQILDCVFTNCAAVRGGATLFGWYSRCKFYDCVSFGGVTWQCYLSGCYVDPSCRKGDGGAEATGGRDNAVLGSDTRAFFTTCPNATIRVSTDVSDQHFHNLYGEQNIGVCRFWGSFFKKAPYIYSGAQGYTIADPQYVNYQTLGGDYRVAGTSPAIANGLVPEREDSEWDSYARLLWIYASSDVNGNPLRITDGVPMAGCDHNPVRGVYVAADNGGLAIEGGSIGFTEANASLSMSISAGNHGNRPCVGFVTSGGSTNLFSESSSFVIAESDIPVNGLYLSALYSNEWYVNADSGQDGNSGASPQSPKQTLSATLANCISGDTVYASAGIYATGSKVLSEQMIAARAHIPCGVMLKGAGAGTTIIVGDRSEGTGSDQHGRGPNAMRCVYLESGARIIGCTLTGGRTMPLGTGNLDNLAGDPGYSGGGVFGEADGADAVALTRVENCIVSNCIALVGGAGHGVTFVNSRLFHCRATRGSATERCGLINTIVDEMDSEGSSGFCVNDSYPIINATIGKNIRKDASGAPYALGWNRTLWPKLYDIVNTVILGYRYWTITSMVNSVGLDSVTGSGFVNCRQINNVEDLGLDEDYRPNIAGSPLLVDKGAPANYGDSDAYGGQRVYNAAVDIGAVEADWRERYAADISSGSLTVKEASPTVQESASHSLLIPEGGMMRFAWHNPNTEMRHYEFMVNVSADSTLKVIQAGSEMTYASPGTYRFTYGDSLAESEVVFLCECGMAELLSARRANGLVMVFR